MAGMGPAAAHPHVWVEARAELVFNADGRVTAVRNVWRFDEAYSAFATQGLDTDGDGTLSATELHPLAQINVESLADFDYFTFLTAGSKAVHFTKPTEYWLQSDGGLLTLYFTLPTKEPVEVRSLAADLDVYDPTYYVAFTFVETDPVHLVDAPAGCVVDVRRPGALDPMTAASLAAIPADQREVPGALAAVTQDLTNGAGLTCP
ncbi:DUF1007 family protein [Methylobrevis pamukkalensis]|nr:DUF1007 family protein [Methylobrevis pamukkalensis]